MSEQPTMRTITFSRLGCNENVEPLTMPTDDRDELSDGVLALTRAVFGRSDASITLGTDGAHGHLYVSDMPVGNFVIEPPLEQLDMPY